VLGSLVAILSLNMTATLVQDGVVHASLPITAATITTPIVISCPAHGCPLGRTIHGVVAGSTGMTEANGVWIATPASADTFTLTTLTPQGLPVNSVGVNAYGGGASLSYAFPDYQILLGRRNVALASAVASPRIVFVPTDGRKWGLEPYGGVGSPASVPNVRGTAEQQSQTTQPQLETEFATFEVYITGSAPDYGAGAPSPDYSDFDATQAIAHALYATMFDTLTPSRVQVLHESWPSQERAAGSMTQRGQQMCIVVEIHQAVTKAALQYVPIGTSLQITVEPVNPGSTDPVVIEVN
jgi:hypothetical protein